MSGTHGSEGGSAFAQSSGELKGLQRELRGAHALWAVLVLEFAGARAHAARRGLPGADGRWPRTGSRLCRRSRTWRRGAAGRHRRRGLPAVAGRPGAAEGAGGEGGWVVDDEGGVGGARPPVAAVLVPAQQQAAGQVIERPDPAGNGQSPVADVDVVEVQFPDGLGPGRVHGGQREREAGGGGDGGGGGRGGTGRLGRAAEVSRSAGR